MVARMQLLFDPLIEALLFHRFHVARARSEGQAVQRMQDFLVRRHLGDRGAARRMRLLLLPRKERHEKQRSRQMNALRRIMRLHL